MIRTIDMQSVLIQSAASEKVTQALQQNQETQARQFALLAEEERAKLKSSVKDSEKSDDVKNHILLSPKEERQGNRQRQQKKDDSKEDDQSKTSGNTIDITI